MKPKPAVTVIGTGAVGSVWIDYFWKAGYTIKSVWNSNSGEIFNTEYGNKKVTGRSYPQKETEIGDLLLITTPDSIISEVSEQLSKIETDWDKKNVVHCSGSFSAEILNPLAKLGAKTASMHPIQTFKKGDDSKRLNNIYISLQGDEDLIRDLKDIVNDLNSNPLILDEKQKQAVHISAVFASNYLVALLNTSDTILKEQGIENGVQILKPLIVQTLHNIFEKGTLLSLTGPVSRGDSSTISDHLERLSNDHEIRELYRVLGRVCLGIIKEQNSLSEEQISNIDKLFG